MAKTRSSTLRPSGKVIQSSSAKGIAVKEKKPTLAKINKKDAKGTVKKSNAGRRGGGVAVSKFRRGATRKTYGAAVKTIPTGKPSKPLSTSASEAGTSVVTFTYSKATPKVSSRYVLDKEAFELLKQAWVTERALRSGNFMAWTLSPDSEEYKIIEKYVSNGQEHGYEIKVKSILGVKLEQDMDFNSEQTNGSEYQLRMMLWHGTRTINVGSILEEGFKCSKRDKLMFGHGVYFADRASKSALYSDGHWGAKIAFMFLCDVYLGKMFRADKANHEYRKPPTVTIKSGETIEYDSVFGVGRNIPDVAEQVDINGCIWPLGKTTSNTEACACCPLNFNEYVVYNSCMIKPKYLVQWERGEEIPKTVP